MDFAWPWVLPLVLLPLAWLAFGRRGASAAASDRPHLLAGEAGPDRVTLGGSAGAARPRVLLCCGLALALVALARPRWGSTEQRETGRAREVLIGLDLSRSMLTTDVKPSRLERSRLLVRSLLDQLQGERVGLVVFAGTAFLQVPLTDDYEIIREFLPHLSPDYLPVGGTNYGALIDTAAAAFAPGDADRYLILLSDGGATDADWRSRIPELTREGVRVIGLGVGTAEGGFIPDGSGGFLKDEQGAVVLSRLESANLRELAEKTGGVYRDANQWVDLPAVLRAMIAAGRPAGFEDRRVVHRAERYQWALAPALALLLLSFWLEFPVRPRSRNVRLRAAAAALCAAFALASARADAPPPPSGALLGEITNRLANGPNPPTAADWAEFAGQTDAWGEPLKAAKQPVPKGPVQDALDAVRRGRSLDPEAANWDRLSRQLEGLLVAPPPPPPPRRQQQRQQERQESSEQSRPSPQNQQPVGGRSPNMPQDPARSDPALSGAMQKLDQVRDEDSPAALYEMIAKKNPRPPQAPAGGKDW